MELEEVFLPLSLAKYAMPILATQQVSIKLTPHISTDYISPLESKLLGIPYWPKPSSEYPHDDHQNLMRLIAQINMEDLSPFLTAKELSFFPKTGILQFFLPKQSYENNFWGLIFNDSKIENNIRVVYHENLNLQNLTTNEIIIVNQEQQYNFPIQQQCKIAFSFEQKFCPIIDNYSSHFFYEEIIPKLTEEEIDTFISAEEFQSEGIKIGGYAHFTQEDFRKESYNINNPWLLLLQIDSTTQNKETIAMWGDSGVANWFIKKNDLIKRDFSKVIFYWE